MADQTTRIAITADASQASGVLGRFGDRIRDVSRTAIASFGSMGTGLAGVRGQATQTTGAFGSLASVAGRALGAVVAFNSVRGLAGLSDQATLAQARMQQVTGSLQAAQEASAGLYDMAQRLQAPFAETQAMFTRMMPAVAELNGGTREASALAEILVSTAKLAGASASEAAAGALQFAQAMASGVLQGDELKSLLENNPVLARELAAALGVTAGELKKMGSEGKLTADVVGNALLGRFEAIQAKAGELPTTVGGAFQRIQNAAAQMFVQFEQGTGVLSAVARTFTEVARVIEIVSSQLRAVGVQSGDTASAGVTAAQMIGRAFASVIDTVSAFIANIQAARNSLGGLVAAAQQFATGNFSSAGEILSDVWRQNVAAGSQLVDAMMAKGAALQAYNAQLASGGQGSSQAGNSSPFARLQSAASAATGGGTAAKGQGRMAQWEADLADRRLSLERTAALEGQYREMSKAEEARYWADLASRRDLSTRERIALARRVATAELAALREGFEAKVQTLQDEAAQYRSNLAERIRIEQQIQALYANGSRGFEESARRIADLRRQAQQQAQQVRDQELAAQQQRQLAEVDIAQQTMQTLQQLGQVDQAQTLQAQEAFEQRRYQILLQGLQQRLQAADADPDRNPVELARLHGELEQLQQQHALRMGQIQGQAAVASRSNLTAVFTDIGSSWANLLRQVASGTVTIGGFIRGIFASVGQALINVGAQMVAQWAIQQVTQRVLGKVLAVGEITNAAARAGAAGVASMAAAPFPLNLSAPAFGASMATAAMAFTPMLAAAKGFDIPAGMNPVVQAHQREMILPATLADTVRDMSQVYSQAQAGAARSTATEPPVQLRTVGSMGEFLMVHRHDLAKAMDRINRDRLR